MKLIDIKDLKAYIFGKNVIENWALENFKPSTITRKIKVDFPKGSCTNNLKIVYYKNNKEKLCAE